MLYVSHFYLHYGITYLILTRQNMVNGAIQLPIIPSHCSRQYRQRQYRGHTPAQTGHTLWSGEQ